MAMRTLTVAKAMGRDRARRTKRPEPPARAGFTLIEFMLVLTVFSILISIVVPRLDASLRKQQSRTAAALFASAHFMARSTAMRYGRQAELHIDATNALFYVVVDTTLYGGKQDTIGPVHRITDGNLTMSSTRSVLCFDRRGLALTGGSCQGGDATVIFTTVGRADTVITTVLGKVMR
jgi:prepilin-type N-terminal cleavage/methylation domain-containing protein